MIKTSYKRSKWFAACRTAALTAAVAAGVGLLSCSGPKLSTANEQYGRGEYFDASKSYRKI